MSLDPLAFVNEWLGGLHPAPPLTDADLKDGEWYQVDMRSTGLLYVDRERALTDAIDLQYPAIAIQMEGGRMIIDGLHRIFKAASLGLSSFPVVLLTEEESQWVRLR